MMRILKQWCDGLMKEWKIIARKRCSFFKHNNETHPLFDTVVEKKDKCLLRVIFNQGGDDLQLKSKRLRLWVMIV